MRIQQLTIVALLSAALAAPVARASAQSIKQIGADVHHTLKTAGNTAKQDAKDAGAATHHALKTTGNDTKATLGHATGIHRVGGTVGEAAGDVSRSGKRVGRSAKHSLKKKSSATHHELTKTGKDAKAQIKP
ncbi:MAG TPA: hypothetical protein VH277_17720 [Gemmatimonadaceae bacterium]|jgi:hypothetical protein|nr:hypothetical protein [Gemmatimonadaceae bacterium]